MKNINDVYKEYLISTLLNNGWIGMNYVFTKGNNIITVNPYSIHVKESVKGFIPCNIEIEFRNISSFPLLGSFIGDN